MFAVVAVFIISACPTETTDPDTDSDAVASAKSALVITYTSGESASAVSNNVTLATNNATHNVGISWSSSATSVITTSGAVTRQSSNVNVTLTATLTKGSASDTRAFALTVIGTSTGDSNTGSEGNTNTVTSGAARIYADASATTNVPLVALSTNDSTRVFKNSAGGANAITLNFTNGDGAGSSSEYLRISETSANSAGAWAVAGWNFGPTFNMQSTANTVIRMYVKSTVANGIALKVEGPAGTGSAEVSKSFVSNGNWQLVTWTFAELTGSANREALANIVIVLNPALTSAQQVVIDIDEVQFAVDANIGSVASAKSALEVGLNDNSSLTSITNDVTLTNTNTTHGVYISWASSDNNVISNNGMVTRLESDTNVTLTATLTKGSASDTKAFSLTVVGTNTDVTDVASAKSALNVGLYAVDTLNTITTNVILMITNTTHDVGISWASSDNNVISNDGTVGLQGGISNVTLTATLTKGSVSDTKAFALTVIGTNTSPSATIFADSSSLSSVTNLAGIMVNSYHGPGGQGSYTTTNGTSGAYGSTNYVTFSNTAASADHGIYEYNAIGGYNGSTNSGAFRFSIRSTTINKIKLKFAGGGAETPEIEMSFSSNGGIWQTVTYPLNTDTFASSGDILTNIEKAIFVFSDANGSVAGIGVQSVDIDEVHFITNN